MVGERLQEVRLASGGLLVPEPIHFGEALLARPTPGHLDAAWLSTGLDRTRAVFLDKGTLAAFGVSDGVLERIADRGDDDLAFVLERQTDNALAELGRSVRSAIERINVPAVRALVRAASLFVSESMVREGFAQVLENKARDLVINESDGCFAPVVILDGYDGGLPVEELTHSGSAEAGNQAGTLEKTLGTHGMYSLATRVWKGACGNYEPRVVAINPSVIDRALCQKTPKWSIRLR